MGEYCFSLLRDHVSTELFFQLSGNRGACNQVDSSYEEGHFKLDIHLPKDLNSDNEQEILSFLDTYCRAKNLFREDIDVDISLVK
ncbi:hypothetical protein [Streptococcus thermophilus]|uniref:hypothetical protein n=1 Tax=Streptococcus thermophilus TaxID=1308 RepID=UPI001F11B6C2|nr:hypothetical protein [Streptococcus thermophilus]